MQKKGIIFWITTILVQVFCISSDLEPSIKMMNKKVQDLKWLPKTWYFWLPHTFLNWRLVWHWTLLYQDEMKQLARSERMAIHASNIANLVLFGAKVFASIESRSLAVIASTLDSLLDLLSAFILWFTTYPMRNPNQYHYPIGKRRMQPVVRHRTFIFWMSEFWSQHDVKEEI